MGASAVAAFGATGRPRSRAAIQARLRERARGSSGSPPLLRIIRAAGRSAGAPSGPASAFPQGKKEFPDARERRMGHIPIALLRRVAR